MQLNPNHNLYILEFRIPFLSVKKDSIYVPSLFNKRCHRLPPFLSNEPGTGKLALICGRTAGGCVFAAFDWLRNWNGWRQEAAWRRSWTFCNS
jgi:hypothetical protein